MIRQAILLLACALGLTACMHTSGGIAASTMPLEPGGYTIIGPAQGRDCVYYLFSFIPLSGGNETHSALAAALRRAGDATALINVTSDTYSQFFIVVSRTCTQVQGTAVRVGG